MAQHAASSNPDPEIMVEEMGALLMSMAQAFEYCSSSLNRYPDPPKHGSDEATDHAHGQVAQDSGRSSV